MTPARLAPLGLVALLIAAPAAAQDAAPAKPAPAIKTAPPAKVKAAEPAARAAADPAKAPDTAAPAKGEGTADAKPGAPAKADAKADANPAPPAKADGKADAKPASPAKGAGKVETKPATKAKAATKPQAASDAPATGTSDDTVKKATEAAGKAAAKANPNASDPEAEKIWRAYEERWAETADYSAGFRQSIEVADVGTKIESAGRFFFAKPDLVRWEYTEGPPQTVVGDGQTIWLYQPDLQQVYKIPYSKAFGRGGLVALLAGRRGVSEKYSTTLQRGDAGTVTIHLKPKEKGEEDLEVRLNSETFDLQGVTVRDAAGSVTTMAFTEAQRNRGSDKAHFAFTPPQGVDIITDQQTGF